MLYLWKNCVDPNPLAVVLCLVCLSLRSLIRSLVLGMGSHVIIWRVNRMIVDAVIVSLLGLLAGPTFPLILDIATNPNTKQKPGVSKQFPNNGYPLIPCKDTKPSPCAPSGGTIDGPRDCVS